MLIASDMRIKETRVVLIVFILVVLFLAGCEKTAPDKLPSGLFGTWITENSRYQDRYLDISDTILRLGTGNDTSNTFFIDHVKQIPGDPAVEWTFFCQNMQGDPYEITLFYAAQDDPASIRLKNMETIVWFKAEQ